MGGALFMNEQVKLIGQRIKDLREIAELSAEEIAGKSGVLEIKISISENEKCNTDFYELVFTS